MWTIAALCSGVLFVIAAWLPNDVVDVIAWLAAMGLGLPVAILTYRAETRPTLRESAVLSGALKRFLRLLGALSLALGLGVLGWLAYVTRPAAAFLSPPSIGQTALLLALVGLGAQLLWRLSDTADGSDRA